uniref:Uncharacterized protein n=1 Tax=Anopheles maculatus TaxID=74869 RepID=A0A182TAY2_9DIPT
MNRSVHSEVPAAPGNIGSYGMFGGNGGGHTNTNNRRRQLVESGAFALLALTVAVLCTSVSATTEATIVNATSVTEFPLSNSSAGRASSRPMFSTGNRLWDALIADCMRKPTFACIQKNVYSFLGEQLDVENVNFTNRVQFLRNRVDFTKYTREANDAIDGEEDNENEIPDARSGK